MRVLLGIGGTDTAFRALDETVERARAAGDEVTVAILDDPERAPTPEEIETRVRERLSDADFDAEVHHLEGHPGSRLVEMAEQGEYDRLVLAGGEQSPMGKIQLGSTVEFVLLNAKTTVTLVR